MKSSGKGQKIRIPGLNKGRTWKKKNPRELLSAGPADEFFQRADCFLRRAFYSL
jgi:hypothetical protein